MPEILPYVYLGYMFVSLYFVFFYLITYASNRKRIYEFPKITKKYSISIVIPAWNEEETLKGTVESVVKSKYPIKKVIIVDDCSTDSTLEIAKKLEKKYKNVKVLHNEKNLGKAGSLNRGIKYTDTELVAVIDCQSYLEKDSISKLIGFFDDPEVGVASAKILVKRKKNILEKLQSLEYAVIAWTRKLLGFADCIYVTPGPLSVYRRKAVLKVGGFDTKNMTEDIEMTWKLVYHKYKVKMSLASHVETVTPRTIRKWYRQRQRWNMGGLQCLGKYKKVIFSSGHNMLGLFIIPYFALTLLLGVVGLGIFSYLVIRRFFLTTLYTKYAFLANVPVVTLNDFYFTSSVLNYIGVVLFVLGLFFTIFALKTIKPKGINIYSPILLLIYLLIYLTAYPIILLISLVRIARGDYRWW